MATLYDSTSAKVDPFSSRFSIDNLLRNDEKIITKPLSAAAIDETRDYDFMESWRRENFLKKRNLTEFFSKSSMPPLDYRKEETKYWIERNNFTNTKQLPLLTSSFSNVPIAYSTDVELIPSPSPTSSTWSPTEVFSRQTMESWFLNRMTQSPSFGHFPQRRSPEIHRTSPYQSWNSSLSSETSGFPTSLSRHDKPSYDEDNEDNNRKGGQVRFSHSQSSELERVFNIQKYISPQERKQLARTLELSERQVKTWFQNRRAKWRRIKLEDEMRARMTEKCLTRLTDDDAQISDGYLRKRIERRDQQD